MAGGIYDLGRREPVYGEADDEDDARVASDEPQMSWRVELVQSQACWYDLVMNPPPQWGGRQPLADALRLMQGQIVDNQADRPGQCLMGFWAARQKVRFCTRKPPRYAMLGGELIFYVELGSQGVRKKLSTTFVDVQTGRPVKPLVQVDDRFITIHLPDEEPETVSIYDFLRKCGLELGVSTDVYAVASTRTPLACWLSGVNRNLTEMLYRVSNEEHDFFFFCNVFKVTPVRLEPAPPWDEGLRVSGDVWHVGATRSATGSPNDALRRVEVSIEERTRMIERTLRAYFQTDSPVLMGAGAAEDDERFTGWVGAARGQVFSVQVLMELNNPHELYRFASDGVAGADKHMFTCRVEHDDIEVTVLK